MSLITKLKYFSIYIILNFIGFYLAFQNWWSKESASPVPIFGILFCFGICWLGIVFMGIMTSQLIFLKDKNDFVSPFSLITTEDYLDNFGEYSKKMKKSIWIINFGIFFLSISVFIYTMSFIKQYQLENYGVIENAKIDRITTDVKGNEYSSIEYNNDKSGSIILTKMFDEAKLINDGDSIKIIYSSKNPDIIEIYSDYESEK